MMKSTKDFENVGPKFELVASATVTLDSCSEGMIKSFLQINFSSLQGFKPVIVCFLFPDTQSHELYIVEPQSEHCLPLFGQFCCRIAAAPYCCEEEVLSGALTLRNAKGKKDQKLWGSLMDWNLKLWMDKSGKDSARLPYLEIPINRGTAIQDIGKNTLREHVNFGMDKISPHLRDYDE